MFGLATSDRTRFDRTKFDRTEDTISWRLRWWLGTKKREAVRLGVVQPQTRVVYRHRLSSKIVSLFCRRRGLAVQEDLQTL